MRIPKKQNAWRSCPPVTLALLLVESNRQRDLAEEARREAEAVTGFLADMLASVDPAIEGRDILVKDVLDQASGELAEEFSDLPEVQAQLNTAIGSTYRVLGEYRLAHEHLDRAYRQYTELYGAEDLHTLGTGEDLGWVFYDVSEYAAAESVWTPLLDAALETYGEKHEFTLMMMRNIGTNRLRLEQSEEGVEILERAYALACEVLGEDDERTWKIANDYALILKDIGQFDLAESLLVGGLEFDRNRYGENHPETLAALQNLANVYREQDLLEKAAPMYEQALIGSEAAYGEDHPHSVRSRHNLALCYSDMKRFDLAEPLSFNVWETRVRTLGADNPSTIASQLNLALLYLRMEKVAEARAAASEAVAHTEATLGSDHLYAIIGTGTVGSTFQEEKRYARAEQMFDEALARYERVLPETHWRPATIHVRRGNARLEQGNYPGAEQDLLLGFRHLEESFSVEHRYAVEAIELLVDLYTRWGRPEDAAIWRAKLPTQSS